MTDVVAVENLVTTVPPVPLIAQTPPRPLLTPQTVGLMGPKKGQLIDYGRVLGSRAGPIGGILALVSGLILLPLALAFAARKCTQGACLPARPRTGYVPVITGTSGVPQIGNGSVPLLLLRCFSCVNSPSRSCEEFILHVSFSRFLEQRADNLVASAGGTETTRIEQTRGKFAGSRRQVD